MNLKDIKTKDQFYEMADIWYQRSHKLREIWQNEQESEIRKKKAFNLWVTLYLKLQIIMPVAIELSQPQPFKFKQGSM